MKLLKGVLLFFVGFSLDASAAQIVSEMDHAACQEFRLAKELRIYKDPSLFIAHLGQIYSEPSQGWEALMSETPILTSLKGTVHLMRLGPDREFKNFGAISKLYELADSRFKGRMAKAGAAGLAPLVMPVKICGNSYADSLGFILATDLKDAQTEEFEEGALPPSIYPNPIPKIKK